MNPSPQPPRFSPERALELGRRTLDIEASAASARHACLDENRSASFAQIPDSRDCLIVGGTPKSRHIALSFATPMTGTGTPALKPLGCMAKVVHADATTATPDQMAIEALEMTLAQADKLPCARLLNTHDLLTAKVI